MQTPEARRRSVRSLNLRPTAPEETMMNIIWNFNLPFKYNGNNGEVMVGRLCPDFVSTNGTKMVILVDGELFHQDILEEYYKDKTYEENGYKVIHFTDRELTELEDLHVATMIMLKLKKPNPT